MAKYQYYGRQAFPNASKECTFSVAVLKNLESKHNKIQQKKPLLFPDLQETADTTVVLVFMKILKSNLKELAEKFFIQEKWR